MLLNNEVMGLERNIKMFRGKPQLSVGTVFDLLVDGTETASAGSKRMKKGKYCIKNIREPLSTKVASLVYVLKCNRRNASYEWVIFTESIDYALSRGYIKVV